MTADSLLTEMQHPLSSFGVDQSNELYFCNYDGSILRFAAAFPASVSDPAEGALREYALVQNYPNPFNPTTEIRYQIPATSYVTLKIYDILGREVSTLVNEVKQPGTYAVQWQANEVSSGIYFYQLRAPGQIATRKMVVTK